MAIAAGLGAVRTSADRWGIGLYSAVPVLVPAGVLSAVLAT